MNRWAEQWQMKFNISKCVHMELGKPQPKEHLYIDGSIIPEASEMKYLGVLLNSNITWSNHITLACSKGNKQLGMLKRCLKGASEKTKILLFNGVVRPILEYVSPV